MNANDFHPLMYDRGRGPELRSCRITVYDLIPYLQSPEYSDKRMQEIWPGVTVEELRVLKAFITANHDKVMAENAKIDERIAKGIAAQNTPEFQARFWWSREKLTAFREWRLDEANTEHRSYDEQLREFREWFETRMLVGVVE
jgi:hypothetical protein